MTISPSLLRMANLPFESSTEQAALQSSKRYRSELASARHAPSAEIAFHHQAAERQLAAKWNFFDTAFGLRLRALAAVAANRIRLCRHGAPALLKRHDVQPARFVRAIKNLRGGYLIRLANSQLGQNISSRSRPVRQQQCNNTTRNCVTDGGQ
ncbi:MAG: hypothetical protein WAR76_23955 [Xanthobacteraceae bacterium]